MEAVPYGRFFDAYGGGIKTFEKSFFFAEGVKNPSVGPKCH